MIILLTGCIEPNGMVQTTLNDKEVRKEQYINALNFYLQKTGYSVVFVDNSNSDISYHFKTYIQSGRLEYLSFCGNQRKERGKGYGECEIIQYALDHSKMIKTSKDKRIAKITGRLIVKNINIIISLHTTFSNHETVFFTINSDLSFPDSRLIIAPNNFYSLLLNSKEDIDDSKGYYFEHALIDIFKKHPNISYSPFYVMPRIEGMSGSTGEIYRNEPNTLSFCIRYAKYSIRQKRLFNQIIKKHGNTSLLAATNDDCL